MILQAYSYHSTDPTIPVQLPFRKAITKSGTMIFLDVPELTRYGEKKPKRKSPIDPIPWPLPIKPSLLKWWIMDVVEISD